MTFKKIMKLSLFLIIIAVGGALSLLYLKRVFFPGTPFVEKVVVENVTLSSDWKEINSEFSMEPKRDKQFILLSLDEPFEDAPYEKGIKAPDGQIFNPEIKLVDQMGSEHVFIYSGALGRSNIIYRNINKTATDRIFDKILIRSSYPVKIRRIIWSYYYMEDIR